MHDVHLCREIFKRLMPDFPDGELKIIDELVNMVTQPMFAIDRGLLVEHLTKIRERKASLLQRIDLSKLELMSNDKFAAALESLGVAAPRKISPTTGVETWALAKTDKEFQALAEHPSEDVQALVAARLGFKSTLEETRTERFIAIHDATKAGLGYPAMPVPLRYSGAHTHRFSGDWSLNLQNLPSRGNTTLRDALVAPDGYVVVTCDSSQVEARLTAWLSGQASLVDQFANNEDVYSSFASKVYGYKVTKQSKTERFLGKTCIAEGTLIYTNRGLVPIEQVTCADKLWDGDAWVSHDGLINNGLKDTLTLCGVSLTPDHRVWCGTQWRDAQCLARDANILSQALGTAAESSPSLGMSKVNEGASAHSSLNVLAAGLSMLWRKIRSRTLQLLDVSCVGETQLLIHESGITATQRSCQTTHTVSGYSTGYHLQSGGATTPETKPSRTTASEELLCGKDGVTIAESFFDMCRRSRIGMWLISRWIELTSMGTTNPATSNSSVENKTSGTSGASQTSKHASENLKRVYDIANAGPQHRFMIATEVGPLIVSNCILGLGFGMGHVKFRETIRVQAAAMGIDLPMNEDDAKRIVWLYRNTYDRINSTWRNLGDLLFDMADGRADGRTFGPCTIQGQSILLPTGLRIQYPDLRREGTDLIYGLGRRIYGGKALENVVQALDRVIVVDAMMRVNARFKHINLRSTHNVHDEGVWIVPENYAEEVKAVALEEFRRRPVWGQDLPLDAEAAMGKTFGACK
jgi:hypothetical protein